MKIFDPIPNIVLLGETNVGKSSLFNLLIGERVSLVGDVRDLTRDVIVKTSTTGNFNLVDLPGIKHMDEVSGYLDKLPSVNGFCIVIDNLGWTEKSKLFLKFAMDSGKKVLLLVNKCDLNYKLSDKHNLETRYISVLRRKGITELNEHISKWFEGYDDQKTISWGFIGRSNVGKSTLLNKILGHERFLAKDEIGTTQEANGVVVQGKNRIFQMVDTPGYRKNNDLSDLEKASQYRLIKAMSETVNHFIVLVDITEGISRVDLLLMDKIWSRGKGLIVGIGMWDKVNDPIVLSNAKKVLTDRFQGVNCVALSGVTGHGVNNLVAMMYTIEQKMKKRVKTSELNKWFGKIKNTDVSSIAGIKYITQIGTNPPTFAFFTSKDIEKPKLRFLERKLAEEVKLQGIHLNLVVKHKPLRNHKKKHK